MNTNQIGYIILESTDIITTLSETYGYSGDVEMEKILFMIALKEMIEEADWYNLSPVIVDLAKNAISSIIRSTPHFVFDIPTGGIYANINSPQTSYTYDFITE